MNIQSYKLPIGWQIKAIEDVYHFTAKPKGLRVGDRLEIPFIPMELMPLRKTFVDTWIMKPTTELGSGTYFENGDLLVAKITPSFENGKQAIAKINQPFGYATTEVIPIQEIEGISDKYYLHFVLLHPEIRKELAEKMDGSTGRQRLRKEMLATKQIIFPPLHEQRRIAHVLTAVQTAIEQQARLIALTRELKSALMRKLFTEGLARPNGSLRPVRSVETEIGPVPEEWKVLPLGEVMDGTPKNGMYKPLEAYGAGTLILRINDFSNDGDIVISASNRIAANESELATYALQEDDIITNRVNSLSHLGKTALVGSLTEPMLFESNMMKYRLTKPKLCPHTLCVFSTRLLARHKLWAAQNVPLLNQALIKVILVQYYCQSPK